MLKPLIPAAAIAATVSTVAYAKGPTDCPHIFGTNGQPHLATTAAPSRMQFLCFRGYAVQTSAATRTALWSAENLTAQDARHPVLRSGALPSIRAVLARY